MNRRGKCYNERFCSQTPFCLLGFVPHYHKLWVSSPLLLSVWVVRLKADLSIVLKMAKVAPIWFFTPPHSASLSKQTSLCRNWTEYKMCRGHGGQPDGSAPTTLQCKGREQVNKAHMQWHLLRLGALRFGFADQAYVLFLEMSVTRPACDKVTKALKISKYLYAQWPPAAMPGNTPNQERSYTDTRFIVAWQTLIFTFK